MCRRTQPIPPAVRTKPVLGARQPARLTAASFSSRHYTTKRVRATSARQQPPATSLPPPTRGPRRTRAAGNCNSCQLLLSNRRQGASQPDPRTWPGRLAQPAGRRQYRRLVRERPPASPCARPAILSKTLRGLGGHYVSCCVIGKFCCCSRAWPPASTRPGGREIRGHRFGWRYFLLAPVRQLRDTIQPPSQPTPPRLCALVDDGQRATS